MSTVQRHPFAQIRLGSGGTKNAGGLRAGQFIQGPPQAVIRQVGRYAIGSDQDRHIRGGPAFGHSIQGGFAEQEIQDHHQQPLPGRHVALAGIPPHGTIDYIDEADVDFVMDQVGPSSRSVI